MLLCGQRLPFGPYMAVTSYGAAVFFDADHIMKEKCLATISEVVHDAVAERKYNEGIIMVVLICAVVIIY